MDVHPVRIQPVPKVYAKGKHLYPMAGDKLRAYVRGTVAGNYHFIHHKNSPENRPGGFNQILIFGYYIKICHSGQRL